MSNYTCIFNFYFCLVLHVQPNYGPTGLKHVADTHTSVSWHAATMKCRNRKA